MTRASILMITAAALLAVACRDLGLPGNIPEEQARRAPPPELVAEVIGPAPEEVTRLVVDGRLWVPQGRPAPRDPGELRPVGATAGMTVYARAWDERPFRAVFTRAPITAPDEAPTAKAAMEARREHWQEYAPVAGLVGRAAAPTRLPIDPTAGAPPTTQNNSN